MYKQIAMEKDGVNYILVRIKRILNCTGILLLLAGFFCPDLAAQNKKSADLKFNFKLHKIDEFRDRMGATALVDLDKDGDLDYVFGRFGEMYWYEHISPSQWILHEIGKGANTDVGGIPLDVNG